MGRVGREGGGYKVPVCLSAIHISAASERGGTSASGGSVGGNFGKGVRKMQFHRPMLPLCFRESSNFISMLTVKAQKEARER